MLGIMLFYTNYIPYDEKIGMYNVLNGNHFKYYSYTKDNKTEIKNLDRYIESVYSELVTKFDVSFADKVEVRIYDTPENMGKLVNVSVIAVGMSNSLGIQMILSENEDMNKVFKHEFIHTVIMKRSLAATANGAFIWLNEGLSDYYATSDKRKDNSLRVSAMTDNLPDLEKVIEDSPEIPSEWGYTIYRSIIGFIIDKYGEDKILEIIDNINSKSLYEILNISYEDFEVEWKNFILNNY